MNPQSSLGRRSFFRSVCACGLVAAGASLLPRTAAAQHAAAPGAPAPHIHTTMTADQALAELKAGNAAFVADRGRPILAARERRLEIAKGQTPFAVLIGCSDSRVPPELLFGRGLGDLFIVRIAGNTVDHAALGSIEYAVSELGVPLVVVLGHERCGAVSAAVSVVRDGTVFDGSIGEMVEPIIPAVLAAQRMPGDLLDNAVRENVKRVVHRLKTSEPALTDPVKTGTVKIVGARYDLEDGAVEFFA